MPPLCHHYAIRLVGRFGIFRAVARNADPSIRRWIFNEVPFVSDKLQNVSRLVDSKTAARLFKTIKLLLVPLNQRHVYATSSKVVQEVNKFSLCNHRNLFGCGEVIRCHEGLCEILNNIIFVKLAGFSWASGNFSKNLLSIYASNIS